jgi:ABC-2 type transport system permease protein
MSLGSPSVADRAVDAAAPAASAVAPRPFFWSVRRELWENRSLILAPLAVGGFAVLAYLIRSLAAPELMRAGWGLVPTNPNAVTLPFSVMAIMVVGAAFLVGFFYSLDALHGERRDRSILFWKSLPVSDRTTVLAKAAIPLLVLPLIVLAIVHAAQLMMLLLGTAALWAHGWSAVPMWRQPFLTLSVSLVYGLAAFALWHAPFYAWLLLVSSWARRAPFLWAALPLLVIAAFEKIAFDSWGFAAFLGHRLVGHIHHAFDHGEAHHIVSLSQITPLRFLAMPGLWLGLAFAGVLLVAAIRQRRDREPI